MRENAEAIPGFEFWVFGPSRRSLMLPSLLVRDLIQEEDKRREEAREKAKAEEDQGPPQVAGESESSEPARKQQEVDKPALDFPEEAAPGYFRVIPRLDEITSPSHGDQARSSVVDSDIVKHREALRTRLRGLGPDRRVGTRGPVAIEALEEIHPNFMEPLRLIRNVVTMMDALAQPVRIPPILLVGPPGIGKTFFTHNLAASLAVPHAVIGFDQPTAGNQLRGSDKHWGNTESGILFNMLCLGEFANPIVLLDEIDKSAGPHGSHQADPVSQLHAALEPQTSARLIDVSTEVEFDASLVTYIATANSLEGLGAPILSRFEIFYVKPPTPAQSLEIAHRMVQQAIVRWKLDGFSFNRRACVVLAALTPRMIQRTLDKVIANALASGSKLIGEDAVWAELGLSGGSETIH